MCKPVYINLFYEETGCHICIIYRNIRILQYANGERVYTPSLIFRNINLKFIKMKNLKIAIAKKTIFVNVHKCEFNEQGEITKIAEATENDRIKAKFNELIDAISIDAFGELTEDGARHFAKHKKALLDKFVVTSSNGERMPLEVVEAEI